MLEVLETILNLLRSFFGECGSVSVVADFYLALASEVNPRLDLKRVGFVQRPLMHGSVSDTQLLVFVVH